MCKKIAYNFTNHFLRFSPKDKKCVINAKIHSPERKKVN
jgi:hypothetical protein